ncbi:MAG TPA: BadF/BadG/BcrA/BcrD ATPase family protein [Steroidobacteraceae bacterium]|nr:BadF/BadG/BcrA/BcrD ATPase family protein [Steroidobacteraceae bacterium]
MFLGVDGGGTKTAYALIDSRGAIRASHVTGSVSYLSEGVARATTLLVEGIGAVLAKAATDAAHVSWAFFGLPSHGEDSAMTAQLDAMPSSLFDGSKYRCGNDMICSWAGSLGCRDGISVVAGTGSIAYGEFAGRNARAGGWGELIGDEGSAYWIAREGMNLFSRMSDGRAGRGPLHALVRERLGIDIDLDVCARIYGDSSMARGAFAQFARLVHDAANAGDVEARAIFVRAASELVGTVLAVRRSLAVPDTVALPVSHSGGAFAGSPALVGDFRTALAASRLPFDWQSPLFPPVIGAALNAARLAGQPLNGAALAQLRQACVTAGPAQ